MGIYMNNTIIIIIFVIYSLISFYYMFVGVLSMDIFEKENKELTEVLYKDKDIAKYIKWLPLAMALLAIFWPLYIILKKIIKIKVVEL